MFLREIEPGVYMSNNMKVYYALDKCPYCGFADTISHHKYTDRCIDCGNMYNLYTVRRTARCKGQLTRRTIRSHMKLLEELQRRREAGLRVPPTFDEEFVEMHKIVKSLNELEAAEAALEAEQRMLLKAVCADCGAEISVKAGVDGPHRCQECLSKYRIYKELYGRIEKLSYDECDQLAKLIRGYIARYGVSNRGPRVSLAIQRLNKRVVALGGEAYIFYSKDGMIR